MKLNICHMYPDVLNLYGDGGNIICMKKRLQWRGIDVRVSKMPIGYGGGLSDYDIIFIGGGQDFDQKVLLEDLHRGKDREIASAIEDGVTFLTVCGGFQMLGQYYETHDGERCDFIGALDMYTVGGKVRMIGNYEFECGSCGSTVVGFENHSGKTMLSSQLEPLGRIISGYGNNGEDGTEGAHYKNTFGTYCHGPMLPKNPDFCDYLLSTALERKYGHSELAPLDDELEVNAHRDFHERMGRKR